MADAILRVDSRSHFHWLEFDAQPDEATRAALKAAGWKWGSYRKQYWTNRRFWEVPEGITTEDGGTCDYSAERSERLHGAAERATERADAAFVAAGQTGGTSPDGEVIRGRGGKRARQRSERLMEKSVEELEKADHLQWKAESSASHQRHAQQPGTIARRIERLKADRTKVKNQLASSLRWIAWEYVKYLDPETKKLPEAIAEEMKAKMAQVKAEREAVMKRIDAEIAENQTLLDQAGGLPFDQLDLHVGDYIWYCGKPRKVLSINKTTVTVEDRWHEHYVQRAKVKKSEITAKSIYSRADGSLAWQPQPQRETAFVAGRSPSHEEQKRRAALLEQMQKEREIEDRVIAGKGNGYFPTPAALAMQMVEKADIQPGMCVLEPSAGKGSIADAIRQTCPHIVLNVIEINPLLRQILQMRGYEPVAYDFMAVHQQGGYARIVMNPPFEHGQDMQHVRHAYDFLDHGGRLVALMLPGFQYQDNRAAKEFRTWLIARPHGIREVDTGVFLSSDRPTGVSCVMVTIDKP